MKKPTILAALVLVVLVGAFVALQASSDKPQQAQTYRIEPMKGLDKIEIKHPDKTITLAYKDKAWRLSDPIDYPITMSVSKNLERVLRGGLKMDLTVAKPELEKYQLGPEAPVVTLFAGDQSQSFRLGKDITVSGTKAKRSFVQPMTGEPVYRAQAGLSGLLGRSVEEWREKQILRFDKDEVLKVDMNYGGKTVTLSKEADKWVSTEGFSVDEGALASFLESLGRLTVSSFVSEKDAASLGFAAPVLTHTLTLKDGRVKTLVVGGKWEKGRAVKLAGEPWVYGLNASGSRAVIKSMGHLRPRDIFALDINTIAEVTLTPEGANKPLSIRREGKDWVLSQPIAGAKLDPGIVTALVRTLGNLKAQRMAEKEITAQQAGLIPGSMSLVRLRLQSGTETLVELGAVPKGGVKDRYARIQGGEIFVLDAFKAQKLVPPLQTLVRPEAPK